MTDAVTLPGASFILSAVVACLFIAILLRSGLVKRLLDQPNSRSLHAKAVPRVGGLGILGGLVVSTLVIGGQLPGFVWVSLVLVVGVSLLDDLRSLPAAVRLPVHLAAGTLVAWSAMPESDGFWLIGLGIALAWMINLYNFMDGSDGLAGLQGCIGFGAMALAAHVGGDPGLACVCAALAGGALGFLCFNWPPARLFMGDAGSTSLGLLAGAVGLSGATSGLWPPSFPVLAFFPFIFDASATLLDRLLRRQRVWQAHREHAYQRLNLSGWGHRKTALAYMAWMLVSASLALNSLRQDAGHLPALLLTITSVALYGIVRHRLTLQRSI